jgi:CubicO group peptidase (beta-lactamase class C family)
MPDATIRSVRVIGCVCSATVVLSAVIIGSTATPQQSSAASMSSVPVALNEAVRAASELPRLYSLLVTRRGELILERYFNGKRATSAANIKSASKSVISALVGIAIDRGHIPSVKQEIAPYFPELKADDPRRHVTIEDLLTMRSGLESTSNRNYGAWVLSSNWVRYALTRPLLNEPGTRMRYSTGNTHLLSAILTRTTKRTTRQFAQETLAKPLGFTLAEWTRDPQGIYFGGNEMSMTPRQMLAFGELYLNRGRVKGVQVVPESWIDASIVPRGRSDISDQLYGYGWWIRQFADQSSFYAWGYGGQFIIVVPSLDLVVVSTSNPNADDERRSHRRTVDDIIENLVIKPLSVDKN